MEQKVAVITGASSGIGYSTAKRLLKDNYIVVGVSRTKNDEFENYFCCDISIKEEVEKTFLEIYKKFGRIDVLVNNAGYGNVGALELTSEEELKKIFEVNVYGAVFCTNAFLKYAKTGAKIVNISSMCNFTPLPYRALYCATKCALTSISCSYYNELKRAKIQVCAICPGVIKTNFSKNRKFNFATNERYGDILERTESDIAKRDHQRVSPEVIANKIAKVLSKKRMSPVVVVGFSNKFVAWLFSVLPYKARLFILDKIFNKKS